MRSEPLLAAVAEVLATHYIDVAWSTSFNTRFLSAFPDYRIARVTVENAGILASLLTRLPGAAYLSSHIVDKLRHCVLLTPVEGAPEIRLALWASWLGASGKRELVELAIDLLGGTRVV